MSVSGHRAIVYGEAHCSRAKQRCAPRTRAGARRAHTLRRGRADAAAQQQNIAPAPRACRRRRAPAARACHATRAACTRAVSLLVQGQTFFLFVLEKKKRYAIVLFFPGLPALREIPESLLHILHRGRHHGVYRYVALSLTHALTTAAQLSRYVHPHSARIAKHRRCARLVASAAHGDVKPCQGSHVARTARIVPVGATTLQRSRTLHLLSAVL